MALADYRLCDVCGAKAFYDANLNYEEDTETPIRDCNVGLDYVGDWVVICQDCAKTHQCVVVPIEEK